MKPTDAEYPIDAPEFSKEVSEMTELEVDQWLENKPPQPLMAESEDYTAFMTRQAWYTKYLNDVILRRDELKAKYEKLNAKAPLVGKDIEDAVSWVVSTGDTPLEFLVKTYRSTSAKMSDRIQAATRVMDFIHRKMPTATQVTTTPDSESKETQEEQIRLMRRVEGLLSERVQDKKRLERVK